jgi:hypothetical protein
MLFIAVDESFCRLSDAVFLKGMAGSYSDFMVFAGFS